MKKNIIAFVAAAVLTIGGAFAQGGYGKGHNGGYQVGNGKYYRADNAYEEYTINKLDNIVKLTRKQENEIKKIENKYDKIAARNRKSLTLDGIKRLEAQKQQEIFTVLTPAQHQRLLAYENAKKPAYYNNNRSNRRG